MHARVTHFRILPGKLDEFTLAIHALIPLAREQPGFRGLLVLRSDAAGKQETQVISLWNSADDLKHSDRNLYFYQAISRVLVCSEGFPSIREQEVLVDEFVA
jgi:heme-degrading monooxygenase HmoA